MLASDLKVKVRLGPRLGRAMTKSAHGITGRCIPLLLFNSCTRSIKDEIDLSPHTELREKVKEMFPNLESIRCMDKGEDKPVVIMLHFDFPDNTSPIHESVDDSILRRIKAAEKKLNLPSPSSLSKKLLSWGPTEDEESSLLEHASSNTTPAPGPSNAD